MERVHSHDASESGSVYSASSQQGYFDSSFLNDDGQGGGTATTPRGVGRGGGTAAGVATRKVVRGIFRKGRQAMSPKREPPLVPTQESISQDPQRRPPLPHVPPRRRRSLSRRKGAADAMSRTVVESNVIVEQDDGFGNPKWDPSQNLFDNVSISDITIKAHNPSKIGTGVASSLDSTMRLCAFLVALSAMLSLGCEVRLRGALFHAGGWSVLCAELTGGSSSSSSTASIVAVLVRELATIATTTMISLAAIVIVILSLEDL